eukprot:GILJ01019243.1.p1 GENE.GILJ01019243.1~~GILJ01019243.1.p1  ORF type:complete len:1667 (+),score=170.02 GILJ01019243.1:198-5003(+)
MAFSTTRSVVANDLSLEGPTATLRTAQLALELEAEKKKNLRLEAASISAHERYETLRDTLPDAVLQAGRRIEKLKRSMAVKTITRIANSMLLFRAREGLRRLNELLVLRRGNAQPSSLVPSPLANSQQDTKRLAHELTKKFSSALHEADLQHKSDESVVAQLRDRLQGLESACTGQQKLLQESRMRVCLSNISKYTERMHRRSLANVITTWAVKACRLTHRDAIDKMQESFEGKKEQIRSFEAKSRLWSRTMRELQVQLEFQKRQHEIAQEALLQSIPHKNFSLKVLLTNVIRKQLRRRCATWRYVCSHANETIARLALAVEKLQHVDQMLLRRDGRNHFIRLQRYSLLLKQRAHILQPGMARIWLCLHSAIRRRKQSALKHCQAVHIQHDRHARLLWRLLKHVHLLQLRRGWHTLTHDTPQPRPDLYSHQLQLLPRILWYQASHRLLRQPLLRWAASCSLQKSCEAQNVLRQRELGAVLLTKFVVGKRRELSTRTLMQIKHFGVYLGWKGDMATEIVHRRKHCMRILLARKLKCLAQRSFASFQRRVHEWKQREQSLRKMKTQIVTRRRCHKTVAVVLSLCMKHFLRRIFTTIYRASNRFAGPVYDSPSLNIDVPAAGDLSKQTSKVLLLQRVCVKLRRRLRAAAFNGYRVHTSRDPSASVDHHRSAIVSTAPPSHMAAAVIHKLCRRWSVRSILLGWIRFHHKQQKWSHLTQLLAIQERARNVRLSQLLTGRARRLEIQSQSRYLLRWKSNMFFQERTAQMDRQRQAIKQLACALLSSRIHQVVSAQRSLQWSRWKVAATLCRELGEQKELSITITRYCRGLSILEAWRHRNALVSVAAVWRKLDVNAICDRALTSMQQDDAQLQQTREDLDRQQTILFSVRKLFGVVKLMLKCRACVYGKCIRKWSVAANINELALQHDSNDSRAKMKWQQEMHHISSLLAFSRTKLLYARLQSFCGAVASSRAKRAVWSYAKWIRVSMSTNLRERRRNGLLASRLSTKRRSLFFLALCRWKLWNVLKVLAPSSPMPPLLYAMMGDRLVNKPPSLAALAARMGNPRDPAYSRDREHKILIMSVHQLHRTLCWKALFASWFKWIRLVDVQLTEEASAKVAEQLHVRLRTTQIRLQAAGSIHSHETRSIQKAKRKWGPKTIKGNVTDEELSSLMQSRKVNSSKTFDNRSRTDTDTEDNKVSIEKAHHQYALVLLLKVQNRYDTFRLMRRFVNWRARSSSMLIHEKLESRLKFRTSYNLLKMVEYKKSQRFALSLSAWKQLTIYQTTAIARSSTAAAFMVRKLDLLLRVWTIRMLIHFVRQLHSTNNHTVSTVTPNPLTALDALLPHSLTGEGPSSWIEQAFEAAESIKSIESMHRTPVQTSRPAKENDAPDTMFVQESLHMSPRAEGYGDTNKLGLSKTFLNALSSKFNRMPLAVSSRQRAVGRIATIESGKEPWLHYREVRTSDSPMIGNSPSVRWQQQPPALSPFTSRRRSSIESMASVGEEESLAQVRNMSIAKGMLQRPSDAHVFDFSKVTAAVPAPARTSFLSTQETSSRDGDTQRLTRTTPARPLDELPPALGLEEQNASPSAVAAAASDIYDHRSLYGPKGIN